MVFPDLGLVTVVRLPEMIIESKIDNYLSYQMPSVNRILGPVGSSNALVVTSVRSSHIQSDINGDYI
jgi:hypothetical protein